MNPFDTPHSEGGPDSRRPQRSSQPPLPPLEIPGNRASQGQHRPPHHAQAPVYNEAAYGAPPRGGAPPYAAYGQGPPPGSSGRGAGGAGAAPGPAVSFQVPQPQRMQPQRAAPSRDSVKSYGDDRKGSMPDLARLDSSTSALNNVNTLDPEAGFSAQNPNFRRKKSLVRPDRERMDPNHRQWYYRNHAAQMDIADSNGGGRVGYMPSTTGHLPQHGAAPHGAGMAHIVGPGGGLSGLGVAGPPPNMPPGGLGRTAPLRRGKSILGRDEDQVESGINVLKRGVSLRRNKSQSGAHSKEVPRDLGEAKQSSIAPGPVGAWMIYCYFLTICCPSPVLKVFGIKTPEQQRAWREKMGLISVVFLCMAAVGFLTFGFTQAICGDQATRYELGKIDGGSMVFHGYDYDFDHFFHPQVGLFNATGIYNKTNPIYSEPWSSGGMDGSLLFQKVGGACTDLIKNRAGGGQPDNYFPCTLLRQNGKGAYNNAKQCHPTNMRNLFDVKSGANVSNTPIVRRGQVSLSWDNVTDTRRNLAVYRGSVLDLGLLSNLSQTVTYPPLFDTLKRRNESWAGKDITASVMRGKLDDQFDCLDQIVRVGFIDSETIGCVASKVELYLALVFILGVVGIKFFMALIFGWFLSWRLGNYAHETYEQRMKRAAEIEQWSDDIYRPAPAGYRPNARKHKSFLPTQSRFSVADPLSMKSGPGAAANRNTLFNEKRATRARLGVGSPLGGSPPGSPLLHGARSSASLVQGSGRDHSRRSSFSGATSGGGGDGNSMACPFPLHNIVPQPGPDYQPFGFPLAHSICLVTAYSESFEGLRTTLDSLATTDYPNSHKLLLVIADGIVKGAGSDISTPDICLSMMKELIVPAEEVEGNSYVAIADGHKRHNMCKIYAGFYDYDDETVERSKQQKVPMILVAKCGTPMEADSAKPGNRGKRDSQVLLMAFMQKVMFDERMTTFEYEFFNSIWRVTGVAPDRYEIVLCVDADTKVFPDSLSRMVACMVEDPEIMGLCGETKIANKAETWVTMIQVFEYYISHHQTKAFEACFGGVTCLPGCFSAYRIKAPKGPHGYWVPILANPDIVEHYSENVVDTLHKKNLLLLGEDRYLTTLMLKTFPKRKMMFVPQAVCKTIVPDTFRILLSQRRRWINSTVHNLFELVLVNDLCGTFCFSMRFVVFMELAGTLVLPAAIAFTLYVVVQAFIPDKPTPTIPLILLALILGLPGILIIVTTRKIAYVGWMLIYLCSLPIWNFVFPMYAYWHMDDFTWGATRVIQGDDNKAHGDTEGKFDPSHIVMKRWAEFERERRWKSGTHSRDSTYDVVQRTGSPERSGSTRYSVVSSDTFHSNPSGQHDQFGRALPSSALLSNSQHGLDNGSEGGHAKSASGARARLDAVPLLELPAPLATDAKQRSNASSTSPTGRTLVDDGPVASAQGVRQVTRGARRNSNQVASPVSPAGSATGGRFSALPPGAAPPSRNPYDQ
ncbi:uncharacterized protein PFL1_01949 [Pseudozyma flocculosa PF-1]|uniref:uncharacterized protein n=1 Tax=Pseudozyma flocculosa PF-1 TaxID=1277687 RepID=UPI0004561AD8|nr:uncharacterized protein PFL1_01949 [Pseudozyma flocculosa PF-1]EPQ30423.1 hypothetical protein PFL1_01949 [Pseudozyma flocculosa PF-1]